VKRGTIVQTVKPQNEFFTGFENMAYINSSLVQGCYATVEKSGACDNGCFAFASLQTPSGGFQKLQHILFKALLDDSHYYDAKSHSYYVQASYDLRPLKCAPVASDLCLLQIDASTGVIRNATYTNYTVYGYSDKTNAQGARLAWVEGFDSLCQHPYNNFLFANVNLATAKATPIACIASDVTVDMDEWIASFSLDDALFATGSGNAETGEVELLVFDTATAHTVLNTKLKGLPAALGAYLKLVWVWGVDFF
jgi:hypothetical protein